MQKTAINLILIFAIILGFGKLYFSKFSYGAHGDDSAGYIFNAGRIYNNLPAIYKDPLVKKGLDFFGDRKAIEFLLPTHSNLINNNGTISTKYPLGISYFMGYFAKILKTNSAFYYLNPLFGVLILILTYILSIYLLKNYKYKYFIAILSVLMLGFSYRFLDAVIAQPMREIVFMFFLILATLFFFGAHTKKNILFLFGTAAALGFAILIRSTGFIFVLIFFILSCVIFIQNFVCHFERSEKSHNFEIPRLSRRNVMVVRNDILHNLFKKENLKIFTKIFLIYAITICILISPLIFYSWQISKNKNISDVYKSKTVVLPDIDHLESLNFQNIFISRGKFQPDQGGLKYYFKIIESVAPFPFFIFLVFLGFFALWRQSENILHDTRKTIFWLFLLNILSYVLLFSAWINPYPRYILPIFPFLIISANFGLIFLLAEIIPRFFTKKFEKIVISLLIVFVFFGYYYGYYFFLKDYRENLIMKTRSITKNDLQNINDIGEKIDDKKTLIIFSTYFKSGLSETFETHTGIRAIRAPYLKERTIIPREKLLKFLNDLAQDYDLYLWFDKSSDSRNNELFFENFTLEKKYNYDFSFSKDTSIYRVKNK